MNKKYISKSKFANRAKQLNKTTAENNLNFTVLSLTLLSQGDTWMVVV